MFQERDEEASSHPAYQDSYFGFIEHVCFGAVINAHAGFKLSCDHIEKICCEWELENKPRCRKWLCILDTVTAHRETKQDKMWHQNNNNNNNNN